MATSSYPGVRRTYIWQGHGDASGLADVVRRVRRDDRMRTTRTALRMGERMSRGGDMENTFRGGVSLYRQRNEARRSRKTRRGPRNVLSVVPIARADPAANRGQGDRRANRQPRSGWSCRQGRGDWPVASGEWAAARRGIAVPDRREGRQPSRAATQGRRRGQHGISRRKTRAAGDVR